MSRSSDDLNYMVYRIWTGANICGQEWLAGVPAPSTPTSKMPGFGFSESIVQLSEKLIKHVARAAPSEASLSVGFFD